MGLATIRAFGAEEFFINKCDNTINANIQVVHHLVAVQRWLGYRLEIIGALVVFAVALFLFFGTDTDLGQSITGGLAGMVRLLLPTYGHSSMPT